MRMFLVIFNLIALLAYGKIVLLEVLTARHPEPLPILIATACFAAIAMNVGYIYSTKPDKNNILLRFGRAFMSAWKRNSSA